MRSIWEKLVNRETVSYTIFGVLTTVTDWAVYTVCRIFHMNVQGATVLSWCGAVAFAFITNKRYVFGSRDWRLTHVLRELVSFVSCRLLTLVVTLAGMTVMVDWLGINDFFSKLVLSVLVIVLNYVLSKVFIFRNKPCEER